MFSTLFYIFLLFYDGLVSKSSEDYNAQIILLNSLIAKKQYTEALVHAQSLKKSTVFENEEIEDLIAVLELRTHLRHNKAHKLTLKNKSIAEVILYSHIKAQNGESAKGLADLHNSIIDIGNVDTLVKAYELYAINFPQNKLKKQSSSAQMISQTQKINTQDALSLLDLMKKKQKNLIY